MRDYHVNGEVDAPRAVLYLWIYPFHLGLIP
jgi:hypothetical protein